MSFCDFDDFEVGVDVIRDRTRFHVVLQFIFCHIGTDHSVGWRKPDLNV